jgi:hypothetical protein
MNESIDLLRCHFGLTPAEARLALQLVAGEPLRAAAVIVTMESVGEPVTPLAQYLAKQLVARPKDRKQIIRPFPILGASTPRRYTHPGAAGTAHR